MKSVARHEAQDDASVFLSLEQQHQQHHFGVDRTIGRVTAVLPEQSVAVNGIPRHVADCRLVEPRETDAMCRKDGGYEDEDSASDSEEDRQPHATSSEEVSSDSEDGCSDVEQQQVVPDRPRRNRQTPIALCFQNIQWAFVTSSSALDTFFYY